MSPDDSAATLVGLNSGETAPPAVYIAPQDGIPWYEQSAIVAHALGSIDGRSESNSAEAFMATYAKGQRVFEVDLVLTSDNKLVARHDFADDSYYTLEQQIPAAGKLMDSRTFTETPIMGLYTPVTIDDITGWLETYDDIWIITDTKATDAETIKTQFELLRDAINSDALLERVIVQLYNYEMYDTVNSVYPFKNYILTLYQLDDRDYNKIGKFCAEHSVAVVVMPVSIADDKTTKTLHSYGLHVYLHTVNRITTMGTMILYNLCDGFYSDYVTQPELQKYTEPATAKKAK